MGLISAACRGLRLIAEEIAERAEQELFNEDAVKAELTELYMSLEAGSLTEEQFARREAELVNRLEEIEQHKQQRSGHGSR